MTRLAPLAFFICGLFACCPEALTEERIGRLIAKNEEMAEPLTALARQAIGEFIGSLPLGERRGSIKLKVRPVDLGSCLHVNYSDELEEAITRCQAQREMDQFAAILFVYSDINGVTKTVTFIPYSLSILHAARNDFIYNHSVDSPVELAEQKKLLMTLFVVAFINDFWSSIKNKSSLAQDEKSILEAGFANNDVALATLCPKLLESSNKTRCEAVQKEFNQSKIEYQTRFP